MNDIPVVNDIISQYDTLAVPALDEDVRYHLIQFGEPETVAGETIGDRRDRLIAKAQELDYHFQDGEVVMAEEEEEEEEFYTPGPAELEQLRLNIAHVSLPAAKQRVNEEYLRYEYDKRHITQLLQFRRWLSTKLERYDIVGTLSIPQNTRAISKVRFNPSGSRIVAGLWNGCIYVLDPGSLEVNLYCNPGHHTEKVSGLAWLNDNDVVSGGQEGKLNVWKLQSEVLVPHQSLSIHEDRITSVVTHPRLPLVILTSNDQTWKLTDLTKQTTYGAFEGHSRAVFAAGCHPDGSVVATGGLDGVTRWWDLRSGRNIITAQSHAAGIYSLDFSPFDSQVATAGGDGTIKIWDMRHMGKSSKELATIPAHTKLVSEVRWFGGEFASPLFVDENDANSAQFSAKGKFLVSSSYDGTVGIHNADLWVKIASLVGHTDKVMLCDVHDSGTPIVLAGWDRLVKLWG